MSDSITDSKVQVAARWELEGTEAHGLINIGFRIRLWSSTRKLSLKNTVSLFPMLTTASCEIKIGIDIAEPGSLKFSK
jgi:hypothetical protein